MATTKMEHPTKCIVNVRMPSRMTKSSVSVRVRAVSPMVGRSRRLGRLRDRRGAFDRMELGAASARNADRLTTDDDPKGPHCSK